MNNSLDFWKGDAWSPFREFENALQSASQGRWQFTPTADVEETDKQYMFSFDLPGLSKEDIKIELLDNQLTVSGERKFEKKTDGRNRHLVERRYGSFQRSFLLPTDIKGDQVEASFENGVLTVVVPKTEAMKPRQITINGGGRKSTAA